MRGEGVADVGEALLRRLQRLLRRVATMDRGDRRQLIALLDDVETTRQSLLRQCAEIETEMRQASVRTTAIGAYLRNVQAGRGKRSN